MQLSWVCASRQVGPGELLEEPAADLASVLWCQAPCPPHEASSDAE